MTGKHPHPSMQSKLGTALLKSLVDLREKKGEILIEDVGAILENMASSIHTEHSQADNFLRNEIGKMAKYIIEAKQEIASLVPTRVDEKENPSPQDLSHASTQLDAVIKATEEATVTILDTADEIQSMVKSMGTGSETEMKLNAAAARIYEACSFQDLAGQRIKKVMATLEYIEAKILKLATLFGEQDEKTREFLQSQPKKAKKRARPDEHLMSGPQMPGSGPTQEQIDALFADIKQA